MELTREQAIAEHRKLWHWIAKETRKGETEVNKYEYFDENGIERVSQDCFCCEYTRSFMLRSNYINDICDNCPINWDNGNGQKYCEDYGTLYDEYMHTYGWERLAELADEIAELPEKENGTTSTTGEE